MTRKQGLKGYMFRIDYEKAYDSLWWSFIRDIVFRTNLPLLLINVIMEFVTSSSFKALLNGEQMSNKFTPLRGIRQGDPLCPYLFFMCMERLYQTIEESIIANRWKPIRASRDGLLLSNLLFANDIILYVEAKLDQAEIIQEVYKAFVKLRDKK